MPELSVPIILLFLLTALGVCGLYISIAHPLPRSRVRLNLAVIVGGVSVQGNEMTITASAVAGTPLTFHIAPTDDAANEAQVTNIVWAVDTGSVSPAANGLAGVFTATDAGTANLTVTATSAGGVVLTDGATITVTAPPPPPPVEATKLNLAVGQ